MGAGESERRGQPGRRGGPGAAADLVTARRSSNRTSSNRAGTEALGWEDFADDDFEEIMSTHYGRKVVLDDKIIMVANPEDAAEHLSFDLKAM
jgi:hypothetical protein